MLKKFFKESFRRQFKQFLLLDYCNLDLAGAPLTTTAPLQRVQTAAARLIIEHRPTDHITHSTSDLATWLPIRWLIDFELFAIM